MTAEDIKRDQAEAAAPAAVASDSSAAPGTPSGTFPLSAPLVIAGSCHAEHTYAMDS
jgi:hypothetical protein